MESLLASLASLERRDSLLLGLTVVVVVAGTDKERAGVAGTS